ncbi:hypothetical protein HQ520_12115 [bacterium]|nr:hypothetical protein [bacterium]
MLRFVKIVLVLGLACAAVGCSNLKALGRADSIEREMRLDRVRHFKAIGDAYWLLGLEYYTLATEAQEAGRTGKAAEYARKAKMYNLFSKDLEQDLRRMEAELAESRPIPETPGGSGSQSLYPSEVYLPVPQAP